MQKSLAKEFEQYCQSEFGRKHIYRISADIPSWEIVRGKKDWKRFHMGRVKLFDYLIKTFPLSIMLYDGLDNPGSFKGGWQEIAECEWLIPEDIDVKEVYSSFRHGDWLIYKPLHNRLTSFQGYNLDDSRSLIRLVNNKSLLFLLKGFHDDDPWFLCINT